MRRQDKFEDLKRVIRTGNLKRDKQYNDHKKKRQKGKIIINETLYKSKQLINTTPTTYPN